MTLRQILLTLLLVTIMLKADKSVPLRFYYDSELEDSNFFTNGELTIETNDKNLAVRSKFVQGKKWSAQYRFNKAKLKFDNDRRKKNFIKTVRENVVHNYHGTVTFHGSDYVHCSVPMNEKLYWATITYQRDKYSVVIIENKNTKLISLNNEKKNNRYKWHKMVPKVLGYRIDPERSIYLRYTRKKIDGQQMEGEYWFLYFKQKRDADAIKKDKLLVEFKNELRRVGGKTIKEDESMVLFQIDDTYGIFRVSNDSFSMEILDKSKFKQTIQAEKLNNSNIKLYGLLFKSGESKLSNDIGTEMTLEKIQHMMEDSPDLIIEIQGHTDNTGDKEENKLLSLARAESVKRALVERGIDASRLKTKGFGDSRPIGNNAVEEGRAKNRRVELRKVKGKISLNIKHFPPLDGYERKIVTFKRGVIDNKNGFRVEGREERGQYTLMREKSSFSTLEITKNYEAIIIKKGGNIISKKEDKLYFIFNNKNNKVAGRLSVFDGYYYLSLIYRKGKR